jgi:hypothetical protein
MVNLPIDSNGAKMQLTACKAALAVTYNTSVAAQVEITLNPLTTLVEVTALNTGLFMRYKTAAGGTAVSSTVFDEFIAAQSTRHYKIPSGVTVLAILEESASSTAVIVEK